MEEQRNIAGESTQAVQSQKEKKSSGNRYVVGLLLFLIICLLGGLTYYVLKDKDIDLLTNITNPKDTENTTFDTDADTPPTIENSETSTIKSTEKTGTFKVAFAYPSEVTPSVRLCFTNVDDISEQYCFWQKDSNDTKDYSNDLEKGKGTLPIGTYSVDYTIYQKKESVYQVYSLRQCVYYADGGEKNAVNVAKYCSSIKKLFNDYLTKLGGSGSMPDQLVNSSEYGGSLITFTIKENQATDLGTISLSPYITD